MLSYQGSIEKHHLNQDLRCETKESDYQGYMRFMLEAYCGWQKERTCVASK